MPFVSKTHTALVSAFMLLSAAAIDSRMGAHLLVPAIAQAADSVTLEDISIEGKTMTLKIPRAIINGTSLTETELAAILDPKSKKPFAERLSSLTAASIIIPELIVTQEIGDTTQVATYYNVELRDVNKGFIGKATSARTSLLNTIDDEDEEVEVLSGSVGTMSIDAIDTVFISRLLTETDISEDRKTQQLYGPYSFNDYNIVIASDDEDETNNGITLTIKNAKGNGSSARLTRNSLSNLMALTDTTDTDFEKLPPAKKRAVLTGASDILSSFDTGDVTISEIMITDSNEDTSKRKFSVSIGSVGISYNDQKLMFAFDDVLFTNKGEKGKDDTISIKHFGLEDLSFKSTIAALDKAAKSDLEKNNSPIENAEIAPTGGKLAINDVKVDFDISDSTSKDATKSKADANEASLLPDTPERLTFSLKSFNTTLGSDISVGIARFQTTITDWRFPIANINDINGMRELLDMGYTDLTLSSVFSGQWDEPKQQVKIDTLSFSAQEIGSVNASALFGNVKKEALSNDFGAVFSALDGASLQEASLTIENGGLLEGIIKQQSKSGAGTEEEIKQQYAALATVGIPAIMGDTVIARKLATAVSHFANTQRKLTITATAKDPKGVPVKSLDLENTEPAALLERFDITTTE